MARVNFTNGHLSISLSLTEQIFSFHGPFHIPLAHVTQASVGDRRDLALTWRVLGTGAGSLMTAGIFTTPHGVIFCDFSGERDCLVLQTRGETFPRLAFTLDDDQDPAAIARDIMERITRPS
jgi:hypothetical protein